MLPEFRQDFNRRYTAAAYQDMLRSLEATARCRLEFRISETPCFLPESLLTALAGAGAELTHQLVGNPDYMRASSAAVPEQYRVPNENPHPQFMTVDFGLVREADGTLAPRLVELQAFPSIYGFQAELSRAYMGRFALDGNLRWLLGGHTEESYWRLLRTVVTGGHDPENVVLLEVDPKNQKTLPDFHVHEDRLGIQAVDIASVVKRNNLLFYPRDGKLVPIHRIYNRAIVDELARKQIALAFDYRDDLKVEWAGHPNWYFRISKFSLPYLHHRTVPPAFFLDDWFAGKAAGKLSEDRENWILKPLYSFAGKGIQFAPTDAELASIPETERQDYLLQQRVYFEPVIETPHGMTQVEIRVMYLWPEGGTLEPVITLLRMGRGLMMGVDHNRNKEWVGASAGLFLPGT